MIETSFQKLMARSGDLLAEIKGVPVANSHSIEYAAPFRATKCYQVLAPPDYVWEDILINLYMPSEIPKSAPVGCSVVVHGHDRIVTCFTSKLCHVLNYSPVGSNLPMHPNFLKRWEAQWSSVYTVEQ